MIVAGTVGLFWEALWPVLMMKAILLLLLLVFYIVSALHCFKKMYFYYYNGLDFSFIFNYF